MFYISRYVHITAVKFKILISLFWITTVYVQLKHQQTVSCDWLFDVHLHVWPRLPVPVVSLIQSIIVIYMNCTAAVETLQTS